MALKIIDSELNALLKYMWDLNQDLQPKFCHVLISHNKNHT